MLRIRPEVDTGTAAAFQPRRTDLDARAAVADFVGAAADAAASAMLRVVGRVDAAAIASGMVWSATALTAHALLVAAASGSACAAVGVGAP
jgi:hypothetical protein